MDEAQVLALVKEVFGCQPLHATRMTFGHTSVTYDVGLPDRHVIVRTNPSTDVFAKTEHNLSTLARLGLPVPQVLAVDLSQTRYPSAYIILEKIPGRDLRYELNIMTQTQMVRLAEQIVSFQRRVASLPPGTGFGYVAIGEQGPFASWWELIRTDGTDDVGSGHNPVLSEYTARVHQLVERFEPYLRQVPPTCFLDDVTIKNVIVQNGELQGLVDFDCVCYGDPLFMVGLTAAGIVSDVGVRALMYVDALCHAWGLTQQQRRVVALYSALHAVGFVHRFANGDTAAWTARMLHMIRRWITVAEDTTHVNLPSA